jgi:NAD(P)H-flavin reductase
MELFRSLVEIVGTTLDAAGVLIVAGGAVIATVRVLLQRLSKGREKNHAAPFLAGFKYSLAVPAKDALDQNRTALDMVLVLV